ncbi:MAG: DUF4368 domain-containing protein, partial [Lachnospiraceae bacterium]|nr:DUF4368 domain-containing protein [Lachnospiraceae bacterium]
SFANVKEDMNFRRYLYRGKENVLTQSIILAIGFDINKLHHKIIDERRISELECEIATDKENSLNVNHFLDLVKRYTEVPELTAEIIREFIEKVYVYHPEKINGQKTQRVRIVWNCIGEIPTQNKTA